MSDEETDIIQFNSFTLDINDFTFLYNSSYSVSKEQRVTHSFIFLFAIIITGICIILYSVAAANKRSQVKVQIEMTAVVTIYYLCKNT